jgi:hypothetical protein
MLLGYQSEGNVSACSECASLPVWISRWFFDGSLTTAAGIAVILLVAFIAAFVLTRSLWRPHELLLTAALGLSVGGTVYLRTDGQVSGLVELQRADPARFAVEEGPRIRAVVRSFGQYRVGYAAAVVLALLFVFVAGTPRLQGAAVGLLVLAALGLTIDFFAEHRAAVYEQALIAQGAIGQGSQP